MKLKIVAVVLLIACGILGVMYIKSHKDATNLQKNVEDTSTTLSSVSNEWQKSSSKLAESQRENTTLVTEVKARETEVVTLSNKLTEMKTQLEKTEAEAKAKEQAAQAELEKRENKIKELEGQNEDLTRQMASLTNRIGELQSKINDTERKLTVSEGDREFLLKELKRLQSEKAELERQFNDLKVLKAQVSKLKDELAVTRRIEFIRAGVFGGMKGAEALMKKPTTPASLKSSTNFNLNVEFKQDSGAKVVAPETKPASTNK